MVAFVLQRRRQRTLHAGTEAKPTASSKGLHVAVVTGNVLVIRYGGRGVSRAGKPIKRLLRLTPVGNPEALRFIPEQGTLNNSLGRNGYGLHSATALASAATMIAVGVACAKTHMHTD